MAELQLTRTPDERRTYALGDVGPVPLEGLLPRKGTGGAGGRAWRFLTRGLFERRVDAVDESGGASGTFQRNAIRRGGQLDWGGRRLVLRPASMWRERYVLADGE